MRTLSSFLDSARRARDMTGKSLLSQLAESLRLRLGPGKLGQSEYFDYGLFDDGRFSAQDKRRFVGYRIFDQINLSLNSRTWGVVSFDKLTFYAICRGTGIPCPEIRAIYDPHGRSFGEVPVYREAAELCECLRRSDFYPFFSKPSHASYGRGSAYAISFDEERDAVVLVDGSTVGVDRFVSELLIPASGLGYVFQERLTPHESIRSMCMSCVSSVRMMVLTTDHGAELFCAIWKIPVSGNWTDNFAHGKSGNMLGMVDPQSGRLVRVINGIGFGQREVERHPETHDLLTDFVVPYWNETLDLCLRGARALPGFRFQHWDIALCEGGPVALELNSQGDLDLGQHVTGRGALTDSVIAALRAAGSTLGSELAAS